MTDIVVAFQKHSVIPDVLTTAPSDLIEVTYPGGKVQLGNELLTPTQVKEEPTAKWAFKENSYYLLAMIDPDAPSRENPKQREWHHWLVGNILGCDIKHGEVLSDYIGAGPPKGTGLHRYIFVVYHQPDFKCNFSKIPKLARNSANKRGKFSISKFAQQFRLGTPIAGNFFVAKYDDYVPKLYASFKK